MPFKSVHLEVFGKVQGELCNSYLSVCVCVFQFVGECTCGALVSMIMVSHSCNVVRHYS